MNVLKRLSISWRAAGCLVLGLSLTPTGHAQHTVGRGAGYSESQVIFAIQSFDLTLSICRSSSRTLCSLSQEQIDALPQILNALTDLQNNLDSVTFATEEERPDLFPAEQGTKFVTAPTPGAPVTINRTLLYLPDGTGLHFPIDLTSAYGLVGEILGYQSASLSSDAAMQLGFTVGTKAMQRSQRLEFGRPTDAVRISDPTKRVRFVVFNIDGPDDGFQNTTLMIQDSEKMLDVTELVKVRALCDAEDIEQFNISQLRHQSMQLNLNRLELQMTAVFQYTCANDPMLIHAKEVALTTFFQQLLVPNPRNRDDRAFRLLPESLSTQELR